MAHGGGGRNCSTRGRQSGRHMRGEAKHPGGRPTSLTPEVRRIILTALNAGTYISTACSLAGISESTFYSWQALADSNNEENRPFREFMEACRRAIAEAEEEDIGHIRTAGKIDWRALAWFLS